MKSLIALALVLSSLAGNSFAKTVTASNTETDDDLCFLKQTELKNYPVVNIVGRCSYDLTLNGMRLKLVAVNDPSDFAKMLDLGTARDVTSVRKVGDTIQISITQDDFTTNGDQVITKKTITIRSLNVARGTFDVTVR
jgi:hypothetical protein